MGTSAGHAESLGISGSSAFCTIVGISCALGVNASIRHLELLHPLQRGDGGSGVVDGGRCAGLRRRPLHEALVQDRLLSSYVKCPLLGYIVLAIRADSAMWC